jgi:lysosomal alpha-mannosidase
VNVFYSTPSCYLYALNKAGRAWPSKTDDFFPYAMKPHGYQTGYYTSRPALKGFERYTNNILQCGRQLNALANLNQRNTLFLLSKHDEFLLHAAHDY